MQPLFVTGTGTGIGKTLISAILVEALNADYWKPVQAGSLDCTDSKLMQSLITNKRTKIYPELYKLKVAASPHIAAREEAIEIDLKKIGHEFEQIQSSINNCQSTIVIEGAGGLLVPLNKKEFVVDLVKMLNAKVILVSRNYLGSINHSLLTAAVCKQQNLNVCGWIFNDQYLNYEEEIIEWSGYRKLASISFVSNINSQSIQQIAYSLKQNITAGL